MNRSNFITLSLCFLMLAGCQPAPKQIIVDAPVDIAYPTAIKDDDTLQEDYPVDPTFVKALQSFTERSFPSILHDADEENINYSPVSLYYPLMLSYEGSEAKTKKELRDVLQLGDLTSDISTQMHNLYQQLFMDYEHGMLKIANSLWFDKQFSIKDSYLETANNDFYTSINTDYRPSYFLENDIYSAASLACHDDYAMHFVLPKEGKTINDILASKEYLTTLSNYDEMNWGEVRFQVPKFDIHSKLNLSTPLQNLGLKQAFTEHAQFPHNSEQTPLFISNIQQESKIHVDEDGMEATSYTAIGKSGGIFERGNDRLDVNLNRPFLYVLTKEVHGLDIPIFIGVCNDPSLV